MTPCPICSGQTRLFDVVDFRISYPESHHPYELSGQPIYYVQCVNCAYLFAPEFQRWTDRDFAERIYNADYVKLDPDFLEARPRNNAELLAALFRSDAADIRHVDYGGGAGFLSRMLSERGWNSTNYDPFMTPEGMPSGRFDLVTAFEVFEHVVDIPRLIRDLTALLDEPGMLLFSTLLSDGRVTYGQRIDWWYVTPISGHIAFHSRQSLALLAARMGLQFGSFTENVHCFFRALPPWAARIHG